MTTSVTSAEVDGRERRAYWALADCWTVARRDLTHLINQPSLIAWQLGFPIVSVLLFVYVFGSAMDVGADYQTYAMPGMFAMTMAFGFMSTAVAVVVDKERGVTDRFRSMPMAGSAVVTGRGVSDVLHAGLDLVVLAVIALVIGWRSDGGLLATLAGFGLLLLLRFALIWIGVYLGLIIRTQEAAGNLFAVAFPFGIVSSVFTPPHLMPDWLGQWGKLDRGERVADGGGLADPHHCGVPPAGGAEIPAPQPMTAPASTTGLDLVLGCCRRG